MMRSRLAASWQTSGYFIPAWFHHLTSRWTGGKGKCSRETRLYHKGSNQHAYERFETVRLASDPALLKRFVFFLGAERVVS